MKINIRELKTKFFKLVAQLIGFGPAKILRQPGSAKSDGIFVADDFDAPLPEDILRDFHS